jgi:hypothetical protein
VLVLNSFSILLFSRSSRSIFFFWRKGGREGGIGGREGGMEGRER